MSKYDYATEMNSILEDENFKKIFNVFTVKTASESELINSESVLEVSDEETAIKEAEKLFDELVTVSEAFAILGMEKSANHILDVAGQINKDLNKYAGYVMQALKAREMVEALFDHFKSLETEDKIEILSPFDGSVKEFLKDQVANELGIEPSLLDELVDDFILEQTEQSPATVREPVADLNLAFDLPQPKDKKEGNPEDVK